MKKVYINKRECEVMYENEEIFLLKKYTPIDYCF